MTPDKANVTFFSYADVREFANQPINKDGLHRRRLMRRDEARAIIHRLRRLSSLPAGEPISLSLTGIRRQN